MALSERPDAIHVAVMRWRMPAGAGAPAEREGFSLLVGDPLFELERAARLVGGRHEVLPRALVFAAVGWLPPLLLTALAGSPHASLVPLHTRFLIAIPVLFWAETVVDLRARAAVNHFTERGLVTPQDLPRFQRIVAEAQHLHRSPRAALIIVLLSFGLSALHGLLGYRSPIHAHVIGAWVAYLSLPLFRIVVLQWLWRWGLWAFLLFRASRLDLRLEPTHPDRTGGLGFLEQATLAFLSLQIATGVVLGGGLLMDFGSTSQRSDIQQEVAAFALVTIAMTLGPLACFSRKLLLCKQRGQLDYGQLASRHNRLFADRWLEGAGGDPLGDPSISSLADMGTSYEKIEAMRPLPVGRQSLVAVLVVCLIPAVPAVLGHVPLQEALKRILKTVLL
jgi:hypothetical protein